MNKEFMDSVAELFGKIGSVKKVYLLSNSIVTILSNPERIDRCGLYDAEQALSKKYPDMKFVFYSSEGEANYSNYEVIYERN
jgi:hypothetical protein